eukprot:scaffold63044_cov56-Attheya_sp.AAC.2
MMIYTSTIIRVIELGMFVARQNGSVQQQISVKDKKNKSSRPRRVRESIRKVFKSVRNRNQDSIANETQTTNLSKSTGTNSTLYPKNVHDLPRSTEEEHYSEEHHDNSALSITIENLDEFLAFPVQSIIVPDDESVISGITVFYKIMAYE